MKWAPFLLLLAAPFWESKAPADWTEDELVRILTDSPWAQMADVPAAKSAPSPSVQIFLATAAPIEQALRERALRYKRKRPNGAEPVIDAEYLAWLEENRGTQIVVAVRIANQDAFASAKETQHMEEESVMQVGRKKFKMTGHFPPTPADPYVRFAFPRQVQPGDKNVRFELYVPGVTPPFREAEFTVKAMLINGKLEL